MDYTNEAVTGSCAHRRGEHLGSSLPSESRDGATDPDRMKTANRLGMAMPNEPVSRENVIDPLLRQAAPERTAELAEIWSSCEPTFVLVDDKLGFQFRTKGSRVEFSAKATELVWLLSFAAWKAV